MPAISNLTTSFAQDVGVWESVLSHFKFQFDLVRDGDIAISPQSTQSMLGCETSHATWACFHLEMSMATEDWSNVRIKCPCHWHAFWKERLELWPYKVASQVFPAKSLLYNIQPITDLCKNWVVNLEGIV
jgi:hypothetical protein